MFFETHETPEGVSLSRIALSQPLGRQLDSGRTVIGNSLRGGEGTAMELFGVAAWSKPLSFLELIELNEEWEPPEQAEAQL